MRIERGLAESQRAEAAGLYWQAFERKLRLPLGPPARGVELLARTLQPDRAVVALDGDDLVGLAGFQLHGRAFVGIGLRTVRQEFGLAGLLWRGPLLALLDRRPRPGELLMDGIVVRSDRRGQGIGTRLLDELAALCREEGLGRIRLDVVDTNPAARRLYERFGFVATRTERTPYLRRPFGFAAATEMVYELSPRA